MGAARSRGAPASSTHTSTTVDRGDPARPNVVIKSRHGPPIVIKPPPIEKNYNRYVHPPPEKIDFASEGAHDFISIFFFFFQGLFSEALSGYSSIIKLIVYVAYLYENEKNSTAATTVSS
jgi:hypothetical protein